MKLEAKHFKALSLDKLRKYVAIIPQVENLNGREINNTSTFVFFFYVHILIDIKVNNIRIDF